MVMVAITLSAIPRCRHWCGASHETITKRETSQERERNRKVLLPLSLFPFFSLLLSSPHPPIKKSSLLPCASVDRERSPRSLAGSHTQTHRGGLEGRGRWRESKKEELINHLERAKYRVGLQHNHFWGQLFGPHGRCFGPES